MVALLPFFFCPLKPLIIQGLWCVTVRNQASERLFRERGKWARASGTRICPRRRRGPTSHPQTPVLVRHHVGVGCAKDRFENRIDMGWVGRGRRSRMPRLSQNR